MKSFRVRQCLLWIVLSVALPMLFLSLAGEINAALYVSQSTAPNGNSAARSTWLGWLNTAGIDFPAYLVDFENSTIGQPVSGLTGLTISEGIVQSSPSFFGSSNPVDTRALALTEGTGTRLTLNFSTSPVDYVAFQDIDQAGATVKVTFSGGAFSTFSLDTTNLGGDSAEFIGLWRGDMPHITMVQVTNVSGSGGWGVDNIEYGQVPIPPTVWLLGSGLIGLVGLRRGIRKYLNK